MGLVFPFVIAHVAAQTASPVLTGSNNRAALYTGNIQLTCTAKSRPQSFSWFLGNTDLNKLISVSGGRHKTTPIENGQVLSVERTELGDAGTYYCSVDGLQKSNGYPYEVIAPPQMVSLGNQTVVVGESTNMAINITFHDKTDIFLSWSRCTNTSNAIRQYNNWSIDQFRTAELPRFNVTLYDAGSYCLSVGTTLFPQQLSPETWLLVKDYPLPPQQVDAQVHNSSTIDINWQLNEVDEVLRDEIQGFRVFYKSEKVDAWNKKTVYGDHVTHTQLTDFPKCTLLDVKVASFGLKLESKRVGVASPIVVRAQSSATDEVFKFYSASKTVTMTFEGREAELCVTGNITKTEIQHLCNATLIKKQTNGVKTDSASYQGSNVYWTAATIETSDQQLLSALIDPCPKLQETCDGHLISHLCREQLWKTLPTTSLDSGDDVSVGLRVGVVVGIVTVTVILGIFFWYRCCKNKGEYTTGEGPEDGLDRESTDGDDGVFEAGQQTQNGVPNISQQETDIDALENRRDWNSSDNQDTSATAGNVPHTPPEVTPPALSRSQSFVVDEASLSVDETDTDDQTVIQTGGECGSSQSSLSTAVSSTTGCHQAEALQAVTTVTALQQLNEKLDGLAAEVRSNHQKLMAEVASGNKKVSEVQDQLDDVGADVKTVKYTTAQTLNIADDIAVHEDSSQR